MKARLLTVLIIFLCLLYLKRESLKIASYSFFVANEFLSVKDNAQSNVNLILGFQQSDSLLENSAIVIQKWKNSDSSSFLSPYSFIVKVLCYIKQHPVQVLKVSETDDVAVMTIKAGYGKDIYIYIYIDKNSTPNKITRIENFSALINQMNCFKK